MPFMQHLCIRYTYFGCVGCSGYWDVLFEQLDIAIMILFLLLLTYFPILTVNSGTLKYIRDNKCHGLSMGIIIGSHLVARTLLCNLMTAYIQFLQRCP